MADYKVTDTELTNIANAIRAKTGKSSQMEFPTEFVSEIGSISGGGGDILTGTTSPASSLGSDGDIYKQEMSIPSNVNFVEYLQSNGTQYIDTGIIVTELIDAIVDAEYIGDYNFVGVRSGNWTSMTSAIYATGAPDNKIAIIKTASASNGNNQALGASVGSRNKMKTKTTKYGNLYNYDEIINSSYVAGNRKESAFTSNGSLIVFGARRSGTIYSEPAKIYRCTLLRNSVPIADYLPCLDGNGVACMWDNIAGEYVYNDGTGDFAYGETITPEPLEPIYYVKENGTWSVIQ